MEIYIKCKKDEFINSIEKGILNYKNPWFSLKFRIKNDVFIIVPNITLIAKIHFDQDL
jgi:hypothetical protein